MWLLLFIMNACIRVSVCVRACVRACAYMLTSLWLWLNMSVRVHLYKALMDWHINLFSSMKPCCKTSCFITMYKIEPCKFQNCVN